MRDKTDEVSPHVTAGERPAPGRLPLHKLGALVYRRLPGARRASLPGMVPQAALAPTAWVGNLLTVISMAALGLGTDLRVGPALEAGSLRR
jgi:hypothetical protein